MANDDLRNLAADMRSASTRAVFKMRPVVSKGADNIKKQMQADLAASKHFKGAAASVSYDLDWAGLSAEIGPDKTRGRRRVRAVGSPLDGGSSDSRYRGGAIANIAYFGGALGGGTVADPQVALDAEAPRFEAALADVIGRLL